MTKTGEELQISKRDLIASYDDFYSVPGRLRETDAFYRWVLDRLAPLPGRRLLDVACGEGHLVRLTRSRRMQGMGCDISHVGSRLARQIIGANANLVADGEHLPFPESSFDYVTNLGSLEHFFHLPIGVQEMCRVLRPAGRAAVFLPNSYYLADIIWKVWRTGYGPSHRQMLERFATMREWGDLLAAGGLVVDRVYKYNLSFPSSMADLRLYRHHPLKLLALLGAWLIPFNLSYSFLYICRKEGDVR